MKPKSALAIEAARRVEKLYIGGSENPRYRQNMFGEDPKGRTKATGTIQPMQKIANARAIAYEADRAQYLRDIKKRGK